MLQNLSNGVNLLQKVEAWSDETERSMCNMNLQLEELANIERRASIEHK